MSEPYVGEIRMFGGNFAPVGWMFCEGQLLPISDYETLFNLIGTTYGGDGQSTFNLPDLRGRLPLHQGSGFVIGQNGGVEQVTLTVPTIPAHSHAALAQSSGGSSSSPRRGVGGLERQPVLQQQLERQYERRGYHGVGQQPAPQQFHALSLRGLYHLAFWGLSFANVGRAKRAALTGGVAGSTLRKGGPDSKTRTTGAWCAVKPRNLSRERGEQYGNAVPE